MQGIRQHAQQAGEPANACRQYDVGATLADTRKHRYGSGDGEIRLETFSGNAELRLE